MCDKDNIYIYIYTTRKKYFKGVYFFTLQRVKTSIKPFSQVVVSAIIIIGGHVIQYFFLNIRKNFSKPLLNIIGLRTYVKFHRFQNLNKIPWVVEPP